jgi:hypothetical protein
MKYNLYLIEEYKFYLSRYGKINGLWIKLRIGILYEI